MKNVSQEQIEFYKARLRTTEGLFEFFVGSIIWGFILIKYNVYLSQTIINFLIFVPESFRVYAAYTVYGALMIPLSIFITWALTTVYSLLFKNRRII